LTAATPADTFPSIAIFLGDEQLRVAEAERELVSRVLGDGAGAFNFAIFQAGEPDVLGRIMDLVRTVPMMSRHRVVVVREVERAPVALLDALMDYAKRPVSSTVLVLTGAKLPEPVKKVNRGIRLQNRVKKIGLVRRFSARDEDPVAFAIERAERAGCRLDRRAAQLLVELAGKDLARLSTELEKAIAFVGGSGSISSAVVEQTASVVGEAEIWSLTAALLRRDVDKALAQSHRLLEEGWATHRMLAMVTWQFRQLLSLQDCLSRGISPKQAGLRMRWSDQREAERSLRAKPLSPAAVLATLARANRQLNRSRAGDRRVFERLIMQLST